MRIVYLSAFHWVFMSRILYIYISYVYFIWNGRRIRYIKYLNTMYKYTTYVIFTPLQLKQDLTRHLFYLFFFCGSLLIFFYFSYFSESHFIYDSHDSLTTWYYLTIDIFNLIFRLWHYCLAYVFFSYF